MIPFLSAMVLHLSAAAVATAPIGIEGGGQPTFQVTIDGTRSDGPVVPRALFSLDGLQAFAPQASRFAQDAFLELNPRGLFTRIPLGALSADPDGAHRLLAEARAEGIEPVLVVSPPGQAGSMLERLGGSSSHLTSGWVRYVQFVPPAQTEPSGDARDRWYGALAATASQLHRRYRG